MRVHLVHIHTEVWCVCLQHKSTHTLKYLMEKFAFTYQHSFVSSNVPRVCRERFLCFVLRVYWAEFRLQPVGAQEIGVTQLYGAGTIYLQAVPQNSARRVYTYHTAYGTTEYKYMYCILNTYCISAQITRAQYRKKEAGDTYRLLKSVHAREYYKA